MRILMVCLGNICRSPIAEGLLKDKVEKNGLNWVVDSAGTESYHVGEAPHRFSQKICLAHGVDISTQRARQFEAEDLTRFDKIYVMATDVYNEIKKVAGKDRKRYEQYMDRVDYFLNELEPGANGSVPDPWYGNEDGYTIVYDMIDETCNAIIEKYK